MAKCLTSTRFLSYLIILLSVVVAAKIVYLLRYSSISPIPSITSHQTYPRFAQYCESSELCSKRDHCNQCSWVDSKRNHSRYIIIGPMTIPREGIGNIIDHVALLLELALKYDLHIAFRGNFTFDRQGELFNIQETLGFTGSSVAVSSEDPLLKKLPVRHLPPYRSERERILEKEMSNNMVVYDPGRKRSAYQKRCLDMAKIITSGMHNRQNACKSPGEILRQLYWNAPLPHSCSVFSSLGSSGNRFTVAVHIRRGDLLPKSPTDLLRDRNVPHCYYVSATEITIRSLRKLLKSKQGLIQVATFSDSPGDSLVDEYGARVNMESDIQRVCDDVGVICKFSLELGGDPLQALQCFAMADAFISSKSLFSLVGGILNPNIKMLANYLSTDMPNAVTIDTENICSHRQDIQQRLDKVVTEWNECRFKI